MHYTVNKERAREKEKRTTAWLQEDEILQSESQEGRPNRLPAFGSKEGEEGVRLYLSRKQQGGKRKLRDEEEKSEGKKPRVAAVEEATGGPCTPKPLWPGGA